MELKDTIDNLASTFEAFKKQNDARLEQIEKKGSADAVTVDQVNKLNDALDSHKERMDKLETATNTAINEGDEKNVDQAVIKHKEAFIDFLRKGDEVGLRDLESKAMSVNIDPDGGYLVTPTISSRIIKKVFETSPVRQVAAQETISTDSLVITVDNDEAAAGWVGETQTRPETNTPQVGKKDIPTHELYAQPKASQKLIDDANVNVEDWLSEKVSDIFSRTENAAFVNGNGVGKPRGFLTYDNGTEWGEIEQINSGTSSQVTADGIIKLLYGLKDQFMPNAVYMSNRLLIRDIRLLKYNEGRYLWQAGLTLGQPDTLNGKPLFAATDMPIAAADSLSLACGDFQRGYQIVDRMGINVLRDPFTDKPFVKFYTTKRVGGDVINFEAIKLLKLAA